MLFSSQTDSRTILDMGGAEKLLGRGYVVPDWQAKKPFRFRGLVSDKEVETVCFGRLERNIGRGIGGGTGGQRKNCRSDERMSSSQALDLIVEREQASASMFQRRFRWLYSGSG